MRLNYRPRNGERRIPKREGDNGVVAFSFRKTTLPQYPPEARAPYVQGLFARIARRYDLMNRLMTVGQDVRWRREVIRLAQLSPGGKLLDLGTGTGDLALEAPRGQPRAMAVGADFTIEMMRIGQRRPETMMVRWVASDALALPFQDETFDAVVSGFLMRNVADVDQACVEQFRVLIPGGRVVCLDTSPQDSAEVRSNWLVPIVRFHLHTVIPLLGRAVSGQADAYRYLSESTDNFLPAPELAARFAQAGFREVGYKRLMFGTVVIHWGRK